VKEADRGTARQKANSARKDYELPIMFICQAGEDLKHCGPLSARIWDIALHFVSSKREMSAYFIKKFSHLNFVFEDDLSESIVVHAGQ
jgi:hypothetical protein